jgi:branched-chain amino acid transport system permease protein
VINWANFVSQCFNGIVLGALLALISSGLTIIYGTLGVLNLAHGAMFMLGGYAGWLAYDYTGSFFVAVVAGSLFVMLVGFVMERVVIRHFYARPQEDQLLVTFGLGFSSAACQRRFRRRRRWRGSRRSASCSIRHTVWRFLASSPLL